MNIQKEAPAFKQMLLLSPKNQRFTDTGYKSA